jgi:hypothetical protein
LGLQGCLDAAKVYLYCLLVSVISVTKSSNSTSTEQIFPALAQLAGQAPGAAGFLGG